jgi:DNA repair exonuclease SbcCD ATPase subunit
MKELKLLTLTLENFKGIKHLEINAEGASLSVYGDNGTGKTTIADAFYWLLFGKDSAGRSDFEIKTLDAYGKPINFIDHSVTASLLVDGRETTLEKIYREKWVRQRGSLDREFQGHETEYIIDGIPKSKAEYTAFIKDIADEDIFRLLTNPMYFNNNIDKKKRREMLFDIFGDITDNEVLTANFAVLGDLSEALEKFTLDELKTATGAKKRRLNADLQAIPNRIDEANRFISTEVIERPDGLPAMLESYRAYMKLQEEKLRDLNTDTAADEYRRKAKEEIRELEFAAGEEYDKARRVCAERSNDVEKADYELRSIDRRADEIKREKARLSSCIDSGNKWLEKYRKDWQTAFDSKYESDNKCPTCRQLLPAEQVEEAVKNFNEKKACNLARIDLDANNTKKRIAEIENEITQLDTELRALEAEREQIQTRKAELVEAEANAEKALAEVKAKHEAIISEKKKALSEWENSRTIDETLSEARKSIEKEIEETRAKIRATEANITTLKNNEMFKARIAELETEARKLTAEYERLEREDYLIGEFTKIKAKMLEEKINSKFKYARFKLFEQQINGGVVETCEVTYNGVPYSVLNNAMKINIGLDVINAFSEHYGLAAVIFLDNAESVTEIFKTASQQVKLYVSAIDDALRVEKDF